MMRRILTTAVLLALLVASASAQTRPREPRVMPQIRAHDGVGGFYQRQFTQIDQLIRLQHMSRANAMLEQLAEAGAPAAEIRLRRIKIALAVEQFERAVELCREALIDAPRDAQLWRQKATALVGLGDPDRARESIDRYLSLIGDPRSGFIAAVDVLSSGMLPAATIALIDSARTVLGEPGFLPRPRAAAMLALGDAEAAAREAQRELAASPYNLPFLRRDLLGESAPAPTEAFERALVELASEPGAPAELAMLAANASLTRGDARRALDLVEPHLDRVAAARSAMANAGVLLLEVPLLADGPERAATVEYVLAVLDRTSAHPRLTVRQRQRALENLASACIVALEEDLLADDPGRAVARFASLLDRVREGHPEAEQLYAAQIALANYTRDRLGDPLAAARRLETLVMDLDLPVEGVALARLALGECYLAARDTARARSVLTALGRDPDFREPAGHAHFLLARLDLAQGHVGSARDRFAAVALDNPAAPYANDALGMGLIIAEELQNPTGGPDLLMRYARSVWFAITDEPDSQRVALRRYLARAEQQVDLETPQPLLERARLELAELARADGDLEAALAMLAEIVEQQPDGRLAPRALALRAEILAEQRGDAPAARREYERLLAQYPDYLFAGEVRERLRALP
ncbi:tetratricopeptide repeat protein [bacterium]|nr:tetratricopeptide repeat protein [bacterium]